MSLATIRRCCQLFVVVGEQQELKKKSWLPIQ